MSYAKGIWKMEGGGVGDFRCEVGMSHQAPKKSEAPLKWKK
jgi:hypothetical protein